MVVDLLNRLQQLLHLFSRLVADHLLLARLRLRLGAGRVVEKAGNGRGAAAEGRAVDQLPRAVDVYHAADLHLLRLFAGQDHRPDVFVNG